MRNTAQIHFFGPINIQTVEALRNMLINASNAPDVDELEILMSSEGGDLNSGFTAYNYIRSISRKTTIVNMGAIESIAMLPFLAGNCRRAVPNSRFVIHNFTWTFHNTPTDLNRVTERNNSLMFDVDRYMSVYSERTQNCTVPIDARMHLTGPAAIIENATAFRAGILTTEDDAFPAVPGQINIFDRIFK